MAGLDPAVHRLPAKPLFLRAGGCFKSLPRLGRGGGYDNEDTAKGLFHKLVTADRAARQN
jgi:hypothetical protein